MMAGAGEMRPIFRPARDLAAGGWRARSPGAAASAPRQVRVVSPGAQPRTMLRDLPTAGMSGRSVVISQAHASDRSDRPRAGTASPSAPGAQGLCTCAARRAAPRLQWQSGPAAFSILGFFGSTQAMEVNQLKRQLKDLSDRMMTLRGFL